jgi:hypothetical protein
LYAASALDVSGTRRRDRRLRIRRQDAIGEAALDGDGLTDLVHVATLERDPFVRPQPGLGAEDDERPVLRAELYFQRVDLLARERDELLRPWTHVRACFDGRVPVHVAPADGGVQRLPHRERQPIARRDGKRCTPGGDVIRGALELAERPPAEFVARGDEALLERVLRALRSLVAL